jgi:hypothetical protein
MRIREALSKQTVFVNFHAYHSVHRESILKKLQRDDTLYSTLLFPVSRSTCFGRNPRPSSGPQFKLYSQHLVLNSVCPAVVVDESGLRV